ncbi:MAG: hypothetical protein JST19_17250 [Bacteroidetes bacterium]|nr:hypothetical protein [Bacteroidota bacterium]
MKKIIVLLILLVIILALFLIPATLHETVQVKAPLFNTYTALMKPEKWEQWRADLRKIAQDDSNSVHIRGKAGQFVIATRNAELKVNLAGDIFHVEDGLTGAPVAYDFAIIPNKDPAIVSVSVYKETNAFHYLLNGIRKYSFDDTHISDLKDFFETDSLRYGYAIHKTKVPDNDLIEIKKEVLTKDKFQAAAKMFTSLTQYAQKEGAKQMQPAIAQFLPRGKDSVQVNVGLFIDKKITPTHEIAFVNMPKGGPLYTVSFRGRFDRRYKAYDALHQYFTDHGYQQAILPFESYPDNKLPVSDTERVNIRLNFASYF